MLCGGLGQEVVWAEVDVLVVSLCLMLLGASAWGGGVVGQV